MMTFQALCEEFDKMMDAVSSYVEEELQKKMKHDILEGRADVRLPFLCDGVNKKWYEHRSNCFLKTLRENGFDVERGWSSDKGEYGEDIKVFVIIVKWAFPNND